MQVGQHMTEAAKQLETAFESGSRADIRAALHNQRSVDLAIQRYKTARNSLDLSHSAAVSLVGNVDNPMYRVPVTNGTVSLNELYLAFAENPDTKDLVKPPQVAAPAARPPRTTPFERRPQYAKSDFQDGDERHKGLSCSLCGGKGHVARTCPKQPLT